MSLLLFKIHVPNVLKQLFTIIYMFEHYDEYTFMSLENIFCRRLNNTIGLQSIS